MSYFDILAAKAGAGGGGSAVLIEKSVTENGTYTAADDEADGYSKVTVDVEPNLTTKSIAANGTYTASTDNADGYSAVTVNVPNTYAAGDEGKVVSNGALVAQTATSTTTNGTIDTTTNNSVVVNVPNTYTQADEGKVVSNGALVAQSSSSTSSNGTVDTTLINSLAISVPTYSAADNGKVVQNGELVVQSTHKPISANGTGIDTTNYSSVDVAVPNSYVAGDEGKVVSNGSLIAQTSDTVTQNGTVDTTLINSLTVNVSASGGAVKLEHSYTNVDAYIIENDYCLEIFGYAAASYSSLTFTIPSTFDMSKIGTEIGGSAYTGPSAIATFGNPIIQGRQITFTIGNSYPSFIVVFSYAFSKAT